MPRWSLPEGSRPSGLCLGEGRVWLHMTEAVLTVWGSPPGRAHSVQRRASGLGRGGSQSFHIEAFVPGSLYVLMRREGTTSILGEGELERCEQGVFGVSVGTGWVTY